MTAEEPRPRGRRVGRLVAYVGGGAGRLVALPVGVFPTRAVLDQRAEVREAEQRLSVLRGQNGEMAEQLAKLDTPEEVERIAREQYNLVRPGEEAYSVLPAPLPPLQLPDLWPFGPLGGPDDASQ